MSTSLLGDTAAATTTEAEAVATESVEKQAETVANDAELTPAETLAKSLLGEDDVIDPEKKDEDEVVADEAKKETETVEDFDLETIAIEGVEIDKDVLRELKEATSTLGIKFSKEQAEALVKIQAKHVEKLNNDLNEQVKKIHAQWKEDYITDSVTRGVSHKEELGLAKKAMKQFGSAELFADLDSSGLGNNKNVIQFMAKVGKLVSEDKMDFGKTTIDSNMSRADRLFK